MLSDRIEQNDNITVVSPRQYLLHSEWSIGYNRPRVTLYKPTRRIAADLAIRHDQVEA
jgi:hypothetical protein